MFFVWTAKSIFLNSSDSFFYCELNILEKEKEKKSLIRRYFLMYSFLRGIAAQLPLVSNYVIMTIMTLYYEENKEIHWKKHPASLGG